LGDTPSEEMPHNSIRGWFRHTVRYSADTERLKMDRGKRGARREEVRIHRYARSTSKLDTARYNAKRAGEIQKKSLRGIALYTVLM
jgi:hypothetical protein